MSVGTISHADYLDRRRRHLLAELSRIAPEPTAELESVLAAQEHLREMTAPASSAYSTFRHAIDAIELYLTKQGKPQTAGEIEHALLDGGFDRNGKRRHLAVRDAINYHIRSREPRLVKTGDGLIALPDWSIDQM